MVKRLRLLKTSMNYSNMSINTSSDSTDTKSIEIESFQEIPLTALSKRSMRKLSNLLNSKKILRSEEGYERDWRGLASLAKQKFLCDENVVSVDDPTKNVIQLWCYNNPKTATFAYLEQFLGIIDRWDASDDIYENLVEDTKRYQKKLRTSLQSEENADIISANINNNFGHGSDSNVLTTSDVIRAQKGLPPQTYDAFVLYADADLNYASEILTKLEDNPEYNLKLCMKDRDLLAGVQFEHLALTQVIEERCKHLIVILTQEFIKSPENNFLVNYTQAQQIQHKTRKIVPLLYEDSVDIPRALKIYSLLRYNSGPGTLFNFWSKLVSSITNVQGATMLLSSTCENDINSTSSINRRGSFRSVSQLNTISSTPIGTPSISVTPCDETKRAKKKEKSLVKPLETHIHGMSKDDITLRPANSIGPLKGSYQNKNAVSMSDLSTSSMCSDNKKKRKWSSKIIKKVFSRSSTKLQEA